MHKEQPMNVDYFIGLGMSLEEAEESAENSYEINFEDFEERFYNAIKAMAQQKENE